MMWALLAVLLTVVVVPRLARRRREGLTVSPSEPISTMRMTKRRTVETTAALNAANKMLR
jgi:hypothetical protein